MADKGSLFGIGESTSLAIKVRPPKQVFLVEQMIVPKERKRESVVSFLNISYMAYIAVWSYDSDAKCTESSQGKRLLTHQVELQRRSLIVA